MSRCPCRPVRRRGCGDSAAASHLSPGHRDLLFLCYLCHNEGHFFFIDVCGCWRDFPAGEQVRQTAAGPVQFHQTFAASLTIDQIQPVMKAKVDVGDGCWWILPSVRAWRCLRQHAGRRIRCISRAARSGMARLCPRATSLSPPRRLCPLPD